MWQIPNFTIVIGMLWKRFALDFPSAIRARLLESAFSLR